ncbi:hypothetical protein EST38_g8392 [Candolleomyces aberdarensis]|uniref:Cytochrome P450 n=1 Tax=Candolleomyces aberdarensis TaxID=2316362 RepID=A0A4Q2DCR4_9AGAR|nr:hypothetical protein EST38_g8392 [Candolleomyces aberdarensis]
MAFTTPGIDFIAQKAIFPALLNYGVLYISLYLSRLSVPQWALVLAAVLPIPGCTFVGMAYRKWRHQQQAEKLGARLAPVIDSRSIGDGLWEYTEEIGTIFNCNVVFEDCIYTLEPEHVKRVLATDFDNFPKGERHIEALSGVLGSGVFSSDGDMWRFHRTMARPFFSRDRVTDLELFDRHIQSAISLMRQRMSAGYAIDFQDLMQRITVDSASEFLFGTSVDSLRITVENLPQPYDHPDYHSSIEAFSFHPSNRISEAFLRAQMVAAQRDKAGWVWPLLEIFGDRAKKEMKLVNEFIDPIVETAVKRNVEKVKSNVGEQVKKDIQDDESFLDHLASQTSDKTIVKDQALNLLLAGRDTIAATSTFLFYLLSQHPEVSTRLRQEVIDKVGPAKRPTYEDIKGMKYLRAVINGALTLHILSPNVPYGVLNQPETLRILPPVPWDTRECINGTVWPSPNTNDKPIYIPPGTQVFYGAIMLHTSEDLWGPDAKEFDPDRWIDDRKQRYIDNPFMFMPFNAGPRICLGQQLAYNELSLIVVRFIQAFSSFTLDEAALPPEARVPTEWSHFNGHGRKGKERFRPKVLLTMSSEGGMWLKAKSIEDN